MKGKSIRVLLAMVLVLSFSLVTAVPVSAAAVGRPTVALSTSLAVATDVVHTISFDIGTSLSATDTITVTFAGAYVTPTTWVDGDVTVDGTSILGASVSTATDAVTIILPAAISTGDNPVVVVFTAAANVPNPVAAGYTLSVATTAETAASTETYTILNLATVSGIEPVKGNVDDTMWVEVTGTNFTGTASTNASTTTLAFGAGITVASTKYISPTSIDAQITINATGAATVTAETAAGVSSTTGTFTAYAAGTPQVDVWEAYDITADPLIAASLDFDQTTTTIQGAEDVCNATETVIVHADTYVEDLVIDTDITLQSLSGAATTIIATAGSTNDIVLITSSGVTIDGFTIQGLSDTGGAVNGIDVRKSGFIIKNNIFEDIYFDNIFLGNISEAITLGLIDDNVFTGMGTGAAAYRPAINVENNANAISGVTVSDNMISNYLGTESAGIQVAETTAAVSSIIVSGNTITNNTFGIATWNDGAATFSDNTVTGNDVGVDIYGDVGTLAPTFTLSENTITGNTSYGIRMRSDSNDFTGAGITIKYNDISGNGDGVAIVTSGSITSDAVALYNYWGDPSGPTVTANARGAGDTITANVTYEPWLHTTQETVVAANSRYYAYNLVDLTTGWNIFSTPIALDEQAATWGNYKTFGVPLALDSGSSAYYFDASLSTPAWDIVIDSYVLRPSDAIYIKMASAQKSPILFSAAVSAPSKDLYPGWNLVSASYIASLAAPAISGEVAIETALASVYYATGASNIGYSVVTSPAVNQTAWSFIRLGTISADLGSDDMVPTKGYWVHMVNGGTLVGAVFTPVSPLIAGP